MKNTHDLKCLHCDSDRVVTGKLKGFASSTSTIFSADELAPALITLGSPAITAKSLLCVACGLVWLSADPKEVEEKLSKYGTAEMKSRVGLD